MYLNEEEKADAGWDWQSNQQIHDNEILAVQLSCLWQCVNSAQTPRLRPAMISTGESHHQHMYWLEV